MQADPAQIATALRRLGQAPRFGPRPAPSDDLQPLVDCLAGGDAAPTGLLKLAREVVQLGVAGDSLQELADTFDLLALDPAPPGVATEALFWRVVELACRSGLGFHAAVRVATPALGDAAPEVLTGLRSGELLEDLLETLAAHLPYSGAAAKPALLLCMAVGASVVGPTRALDQQLETLRRLHAKAATLPSSPPPEAWVKADRGLLEALAWRMLCWGLESGWSLPRALEQVSDETGPLTLPDDVRRAWQHGEAVAPLTRQSALEALERTVDAFPETT